MRGCEMDNLAGQQIKGYELKERIAAGVMNEAPRGAPNGSENTFTANEDGIATVTMEIVSSKYHRGSLWWDNTGTPVILEQPG